MSYIRTGELTVGMKKTYQVSIQRTQHLDFSSVSIDHMVQLLYKIGIQSTSGWLGCNTGLQMLFIQWHEWIHHTLCYDSLTVIIDFAIMSWVILT